jgi:hypothetical protein
MAPVAAAIAGACALSTSTSTEPDPEPEGASDDAAGRDLPDGGAADEPGGPDDADASRSSPPAPGEGPAAASRCARTPRAHEVTIDDASVLVTVYEECRPGPERDLGDPPPGP